MMATVKKRFIFRCLPFTHFMPLLQIHLLKFAPRRCFLSAVALRTSDAFEQQIRRIYELLTDSGAEVTWNDHIPDPDNPAQSRQIDVTIKRDGALTLVECRQHNSRQNVKWVEELMGRRLSLGAQSVIAVSSSGFTAGAVNKAKKHGIILRDLQQLTEQEVASWGQRVSITLFFYQYSDLRASFVFARESILKLDTQAMKSELKWHPCVQSLFNAAARKLDELNLLANKRFSQKMEFALRLEFPGLRMCGEPVAEVLFSGSACLIALDVAAPLVRGYGEPKQDSAQREIKVQEFTSLGSTSIAHDGSRIWAFFDWSQVEVPPFCQFRFFNVEGEQELDYEAVEFYGFDEKLKVKGKGLTVTVRPSG